MPSLITLHEIVIMTFYLSYEDILDVSVTYLYPVLIESRSTLEVSISL